MRLRSRLVLLILATMVPLLAFSAATQYLRYRAAEQQAASEQVDNKARAVHQAVQARLVALRVLALEPELQTGDFAGFHRTAQALIAHELPGASMLVLGHDGRQLMNTDVPAGMPLPPRKNLDSLRRVFETGQPVLSDLFVGAMTDAPLVAIEVPVKRRDGTVVYDLALNPTPNAFLEPIHDSESTAAVTTVYDRAGVVVTRSRDRSTHIGQKAPEPLLSRILAAEHRPFRLATPDGEDKVVALSRVDPFGWTVAIELPADELARAALRSLLPTLAVGGILVVLSAALAAAAAQRIAAPIDALRRMDDDPSEKDRALLNGLPEVREVARSLTDARQRVREHTSALERMIDHRDLLLREVHHRVKNNLQMVDAMLAMQSRRIDDTRTVASIEQLRDRVHALAVVHAQLMTSPDLRTFDAAGFLRELAASLSASISSRERNIPITVDADPVPITLDIASPIGLLLTEFVTNCAKHAYRNAAGMIRVQFRLLPERTALFAVEDDGKDPVAAEHFNRSEHSLGVKLVNGLVKQLDGEMSVEYDDGLRIKVRIPLPEDSK